MLTRRLLHHHWLAGMLLARAHQHATMRCRATHPPAIRHNHICTCTCTCTASCPPFMHSMAHQHGSLSTGSRVRKLMRGSGRCARRTRRSWGFFRKFECPLLPKFEVRSQLMATAAAYAYALPSRPLPPCTYERPLVGLRRLARSMLLALASGLTCVLACIGGSRVCVWAHTCAHIASVSIHLCSAICARDRQRTNLEMHVLVIDRR